MKLRIEMCDNVIRPAAPVTGADLADLGSNFSWELTSAAAWTLAGLWMLAARSPNAFVHVPMPGGLDIMLGHRNPQRWKQLRNRLKTWAPHTVSWNPNDIPAWEVVHASRGTYPGLRQRLQANTLCLAGQPETFRMTARYVFDLTHPASHSATLHPADGHFTADGRAVYLMRRMPA